MNSGEQEAGMTAVTTDLAPVWSDWTRLVRPRTAAAVAATATAGVVTDVALRQGPPTIAGALLILVAAVALLAAGDLKNRQSVVLVAIVPLFGACLAIRSSAWLLPLDILAAGALLALAASYARGGSVLDLSAPGAVVHALRAIANAILAPAYLLGGTSSTKRASVLRGALLALPLLIVVGALLGSADVIFAEAISIDWSEAFFHAGALILGTWTMAALLRLSSVGPPADVVVFRPRLGVTEWTIVLASLDILLAGFAAARVIAFTEGGQRVIETAGLTYAEYARSGFVQLIAASVIAFGALLVLRPLVEGSARRRFVVLAEIALGLLILVVVQAAQRLFLYERAFGLTMPRLIATAACIGLGLVFVAAAVWFGGVGSDRHWFWAAAGATGLAILFVLNAVNAEALVVQRNVDHARETGKFDVAELRELGDDAVPALEAALPRLPADVRREVIDSLCALHPQRPGSLWAYNASQDGAIEARNRVCSR